MCVCVYVCMYIYIYVYTYYTYYTCMYWRVVPIRRSLSLSIYIYITTHIQTIIFVLLFVFGKLLRWLCQKALDKCMTVKNNYAQSTY